MRTIQLLSKAGLLIDALAESPATHAELAKSLDEPRSSIYRLTASLEEAGYVRQTGDGRLDLGVAILHLGDSAVSALVDRSGLRQQLRWIRDQLGMTALFCALQDSRVTCLDLAEGTDVDLIYLVPGRTLPQHAGATSHALLAFGPEQTRDAILRQGSYPQVSDAAPATGEELRARLRQAVDQGWSMDDGELSEGIATIAVPVLDDRGELVGAVAVAGLSANLLARTETVCSVLGVAAEAIAHIRVTPAAPATGHPPAPETAGKSPSVIAKAAALMEVLEREGAAPSGYLAEQLNEPVSSVYRMLHTLSEAGWVEQDGRRSAYRVGLRMLSLSEILLRRMDIRQIAAPVMRRIHALTGETIFLCIRHGTQAVCIERLDGIRVNSRVLQLGSSLPLHIGAAPRALLAFDDQSAWEEYARSLGSEGYNWRMDPSRAELFRHLAEDREQGFVLVDNEITSGIAAVGAPVHNHRGEVVASLSMSGIREAILEETPGRASAVDLILQGTHELSRALGADGGSVAPPHVRTLGSVSSIMG